MLMLLFSAGDERYVINCKDIKKVLPKVNYQKANRFHPAVVGVMNYREHSVYVIDFSKLVSGEYCSNSYLTRIILCESDNDHPYIVAFLAEKVIQTVDHQPTDFIDSSLTLKRFPFLGNFLTDEDGLIQIVHVKELLEYASSTIFVNELKEPSK